LLTVHRANSSIKRLKTTKKDHQKIDKKLMSFGGLTQASADTVCSEI